MIYTSRKQFLLLSNNNVYYQSTSNAYFNMQIGTILIFHIRVCYVRTLFSIFFLYLLILTFILYKTIEYSSWKVTFIVFHYFQLFISYKRSVFIPGVILSFVIQGCAVSCLARYACFTIHVNIENLPKHFDCILLYHSMIVKQSNSLCK